MKNSPKLIKTWSELKECSSETHILEIDVDDGNGWIVDKKDNENNFYLSTHTFYGSTYEYSTKRLQECGFNVQLKNWDA